MIKTYEEFKRALGQAPGPGDVDKQSVPAGGGGTAGSARPSAAPGPGDVSSDRPATVTNVQANQAVSHMQMAMQDLANTVMRDQEAATMFKSQEDTAKNPAAAQQAKSKKDFGDFLAEQYMGTVPKNQRGVEWTMDPSKSTFKQKKPGQTGIYELNVVMDTMKRIGGARSEFRPDGNWSWRTDNALKNMMGFGYALLQLEGDFGLKNDIFTHENWGVLAKALSGYEVEGNNVQLTPAQKQQKAKIIAPLLKKIAQLYDKFRNDVLANKDLRPLIEGDKPFDFKAVTPTYTKEQMNFASKSYEGIDTTPYSAPNRPGKKQDFIPLKALTSAKEYLEYMKDIGIADKNEAIKIFNEVIKPAVLKTPFTEKSSGETEKEYQEYGF